MRKPAGGYLFDVSNYVFLFLLALTTLYPLWHELSLSFSSMAQVMKGGLFFWPKEFTTAAYHNVLSSKYIWTVYGNSIFVTATGTILNLFLTAATAYPLTKMGLPLRKTIVFLILFTMLFGGGMIPTYLLVKQLGMVNTLWSLVIPGAINAFNVFIMIGFIQTIPTEIEDSAMMDGANPIRIFFSIILPLSKPVLATVALWEAVAHWNSYFPAILYINDKSNYTLPLLLKDIINGQQMASLMADGSNNTTTDAVIAATIILTLLPILCVYPFLQKYFVKGAMIGSIKQ